MDARERKLEATVDELERELVVIAVFADTDRDRSVFDQWKLPKP